jgi:2-dehydropantoate 2-reductase
MLAVRLARAGADVLCVARAETAAAIARDGLSLELPDGALHARVRALETLDEPASVLLVTVKAYGLDEALARVRTDALGAVVPLLNGVEHMTPLRERFGARAVAASIGGLEAYRAGPATVVQTTGTPRVTLAGGDDVPAEAGMLAELLASAGVEVRRAPERDVLWEKAARLAPLAAVTVASGLAVGEILGEPSWRARLESALAEACAVAAAEGADVDASGQWAIIAAMPATLTTSAARDVAAGRPSELDALAGAVVRAGARAGVPTPALEGLLAEARG